jgi:hypothetical protein
VHLRFFSVLKKNVELMCLVILRADQVFREEEEEEREIQIFSVYQSYSVARSKEK